MFIKKVKNSKDGTHRLYLVESYRNKVGKPRHRVLKSYGVLENLQKENPNILQELKLEAGRLTDESENTQTIKIDFTKLQEKSLLNYGYVILDKIYHDLDISSFVKNFESTKRIKYSLNDVLRLLVYSRCLNPTSKQGTFNHRINYYNQFNSMKLKDMYKSLDHFHEMKDDLLLHIHHKIDDMRKRDCSLIFYDVTNYYFESETIFGLRQKGVSKEKQNTGIVQMGLFIDSEGIPITYQLFPGNTNDLSTMKPILNKIKEKYNLGSITIVADKGNNSGENLAYIDDHKDYYIISQKIRGRKKEFKELVLDESGYKYNHDHTFKSKKIHRQREVKRSDGSVYVINENVLCFWSLKEETYQKNKRGDIEERIEKYRKKPSLLNASNSFGIKKYFKEVTIDKETGEYKKIQKQYMFDEDKYLKDTALDGYYCIVTNNLKLEAYDLIDNYRRLSMIEDSFRVTKTDLEGRPVYVWTDEHIEAHFLTCFLSLTIYRLLQLSLKESYPIHQYKKALNSAQLIELEQGVFKLNKSDDLFKEVLKTYNIDLDKSYYKEEHFNSILKMIR